MSARAAQRSSREAKSPENQRIFRSHRRCGDNVAQYGRLPHGGSSQKYEGDRMSTRSVSISLAASRDELAQCLAIRHAVFVVEQGVDARLERDACDATALHFLAVCGHVPVGTARVVMMSDRTSAKIGRVAVLDAARGQGIGAALMRAIIEHASLGGIASFELHAQIQARTFYEQLGFSVEGEPFEEAGLPHVAMRLSR